MTTVPKDELIKALEYLEIPIPKSLEKGLETKDLDGSEKNGGDSGSNDLDKKRSEIQAKIQKSKKEQEELEEDLKKCGSSKTMEKSKEGSEELPTEKDGDEEKPEEVAEETKDLKKSIDSLTILVKSQMGKTESLEKSLREQSELLNTPIERRSAAGISEMRKSLGFDEIDKRGDGGAGSTTKISILEKGRVSNVLMGILTEGATPNGGLENAIMAYEASGYLDQTTIDLVKSKGIEIIK